MICDIFFNDSSDANELVPEMKGQLLIHATTVIEPKITFIAISISHGICDGEGMIDVILRPDSISEPPLPL